MSMVISQKGNKMPVDKETLKAIRKSFTTTKKAAAGFQEVAQLDLQKEATANYAMKKQIQSLFPENDNPTLEEIEDLFQIAPWSRTNTKDALCRIAAIGFGFKRGKRIFTASVDLSIAGSCTPGQIVGMLTTILDILDHGGECKINQKGINHA